MKHLVKCASAVLLSAALCFGYGTTQSSAKPKSASSTSATARKSSKSKKAHTSSRKGKHSKKASWRHSQQKIDPDRARQIQAALIREHYLSGEPSGVWDQKSQNAMVQFQAANGWQTKVIPDSRALIKLGLGPSHDHLLNPESAMTSPLQPRNAVEHTPPASALEHTPPASAPSAPASPGPQPVSDPQK